MVDANSMYAVEDVEASAGRLDQYVEQYVEFLARARPTPPSADGLTFAELEEAHDMMRLLYAHWGSRAPSTLTVEGATSEKQPDVLLRHYGADLGWANWITYELGNFGITCSVMSIDAEPRSELRRGRRWPWVITVLPSEYSQRFNALEVLPSAHRGASLFVRVDNCLVEGIDRSQCIDLVGCDEDVARKRLLEKLPPRFWSHARAIDEQQPVFTLPLQLCLQNVGERLNSSIGLVFGILNPSRSQRTSHIPPMMLATIRERLSPQARYKCAQAAIELVSFAEVKLKLGNLLEAEECYQQALTIDQLVHGPHGGDGTVSILRGREYWRRVESALSDAHRVRAQFRG